MDHDKWLYMGVRMEEPSCKKVPPNHLQEPLKNVYY